MTRKSLLCCAAAVLISLSAFSSTVVYAADVWSVRDTQLRKSPAFGSKKQASVAKGSQLNRLKRKGGWVQVRHKGNQGWLRSYEVRSNKLNITTSTSGQKSGLASTIQGLSRSTTSLFGSKASQSTKRSVVATLGVRGLSEDQLNKAKPDYKALDGLSAFQATASQAKSLAKQAKLRSSTVRYISQSAK